MKKRTRPTSSSSSMVASLAGGPSDDAVARLIALEVGNWTGSQKRVVVGAGNVDSSHP